MTIVMGLDQHRAQVTADWLDTETGEVSRARVMPADRAGVRQFLARFAEKFFFDFSKKSLHFFSLKNAYCSLRFFKSVPSMPNLT